MRSNWRTPNWQAIAQYNCAFQQFIGEILEGKRGIPGLSFDRLCLCYCVLQATQVESLNAWDAILYNSVDWLTPVWTAWHSRLSTSRCI